MATIFAYIDSCLIPLYNGHLLTTAATFLYPQGHGLLQIATGITKGDDLILQIATVQSRLYLSNATLWPYELSHAIFLSN